MKEKRQLLFNALCDQITDLLYYDRQEDEDLTLDDIKELLNKENKEQTKQELKQCFDKIIEEIK